MLTVNLSNGRGCGSRSKGSVYLCTGQSELGTRIEEFIWDPIKPWKEDWQRGYKLLEWNGVNHVAIFVGKQHYPALWDFVEEARRFGSSRKVDQDFPFEKLTHGESNMIYLHSRAIPQFGFSLDREKPLKDCTYNAFEFDVWDRKKDLSPGWHPLNEGSSSIFPCTFAHRDLAMVIHDDSNPIEGTDGVEIVRPSLYYHGKYPYIPSLAKGEKLEWEIGAFMATPITHIEFSQVENEKAKQNAETAGFQTFVCDW